MRILVLNYEYPPLGGGAAPVCRDLAEGMARAGHQVTVVTMGFRGLPGREMSGGVEIVRLPCLRLRAHACLPWEQYSYILAARRFLKRRLAEQSYDVCHTHFVIPTGPVARWVKKRWGLPYVITAHGSDVEGYNSKLWMRAMHAALRPFWRRIVAEADCVAVPSAFLLGLLKKAKADGRYVLIPNGLDTEKYRSEPGDKKRRILVMGRMQPSKNVQTILRAAAKLPDAVWGDWTMDILGDGPIRGELEQLAQALGLESRLRFHGWIDNGTPEQLAFLRQAAIYVTASRFENCPMAVLEALAAGCAPLLSDIEGHRQFFEDAPGQKAVFFPPDDEEALAGKLGALLRHWPEGIENREPAEIRRFDLDRITERYLELLASAAGQGEKAHG